jgi:hypothetical protein
MIYTDSFVYMPELNTPRLRLRRLLRSRFAVRLLVHRFGEHIEFFCHGTSFNAAFQPPSTTG